MGALTGSIGTVGGKISGPSTKAVGAAVGARGPGQVGGMMPALGGLAPGQAKLPGGAGGGMPTMMSATPGAPQGAGPAGPAGQAGWAGQLGGNLTQKFAQLQQQAQQQQQGAPGPLGQQSGQLGQAGQPPQQAGQLQAPQPLTGAAALGAATPNPRLQRYLGKMTPATGARSGWMAQARQKTGF